MCLICFIIFALHVQFCWSTSQFNVSKVSTQQPLPIETLFDLPSPLPKWSSGGGFARGFIDLGGLQVSQISTFRKVWVSFEGGPDNIGATFFEPLSIPDGFYMLGSYSQPNNKPLFGSILVVKDTTTKAILAMPKDYTLIWSSENLHIHQHGVGFIWLPIPHDGYVAVGHVVTSKPEKPSLDKICCVRSDFIDYNEQNGSWIWGDYDDFNIYDSSLRNELSNATGIPIGSFITSSNGTTSTISSAYIKNVQNQASSMPNLIQLLELFTEYSPLIYFHPDEEFFPSSVNWFFENGALLYKNTPNGTTSVSIDPDGSNLPQGGSNDGAFWIDLPSNSDEKNRVAKGYLQDAKLYIHAKPSQGGSCTDIALWVFYPYNGSARAKFLFTNIKLGRIGEHVSDWEHVTLRINNFDGKLNSVFYSQHAKGQWVSATDVKYKTGTNKPLVYASLHGHAAYPDQGEHLLGGNSKIGIRNDAIESDLYLDAKDKYELVSADYLGNVVDEPKWLNFAREWGPKIDYDIDQELNDVASQLPKLLRKLFRKLIEKIPLEFLGEEGPIGPKWKNSWNGDESTWSVFDF